MLSRVASAGIPRTGCPGSYNAGKTAGYMTVSAERESAPSQPLHQRIRSEIEGNILSGRWPPGYHLPSEEELTQDFACSRMTMNKVLSALAAAGLIERRRRAGTFVSQPRVHSAVLKIPDMRAEIERRGERYSYELLTKRRRVATAEDRSRLGGSDRVSILMLRCRHLSNGRPFAFEDRVLNLNEVPDALNQNFSTLPPSTWLVGHVPWSEAEHRITAHSADDTVAAILDIKIGDACLVIERRTWFNGAPITAVRTTHPGHLYDLIARFTPAS